MDVWPEREDSELQFSKKVQLDGGFTRLVEEIKTANIHLPSNPQIVTGMVDFETPINSIVVPIEDGIGSKPMDIKNGYAIAQDASHVISGYDESIAYYASLEGKVAYVSHSLVTMYNGIYYPLNRLTLLFCTKSELVHKKIPGSIIATEWSVDDTIGVEIAKQKKDFLLENAIPNSILLIDGPLLAGSGSFTFYEAIEKLLGKSIIPVFIVKNSYATMLVDNVKDLKGVYNSDLHFANEILTEGSRTTFFEYKTEQGSKSKAFCYMKYKNNYSPFRVEIPIKLYNERPDLVNNIMDLLYYLIKVQGKQNNPQVRLIAIAEMFARETLKLIDVSKDSIQMKLTATMNENRGME